MTAESLTDRLRGALADPATDDAFDVDRELDTVLTGLGLDRADTGGAIEFLGADPVVPSTLRLGAAASIGLVTKSVAMAALWRHRGGAGQDISMDLRVAPHRLCPFYDKKWELLNGYAGGSSSNPTGALGFRFYRCADGRFVMPMNPYPKLKVGAQRLLGVPDDEAAVVAAIGGWNAAELEEAGSAAGIVMPMLRSTEQLLAEPHYRDVLADLPLVQVTKIDDSAPEPLPPAATAPLDGIRALGMGHVIAGAGLGRALALHGADVLNLWRPNELEHDSTYLSANVGLRSATVDPYDERGRALISGLLADSDVFFANRRPGYLADVGLSPEQAAAIRPGIVHVTASLNGESGPWADRVGFDQSAGSLVGMMLREGGGDEPALPPILVVNDYIASWLLAAAVVTALLRRADEGGSYRVHVSLTRAALWILSLGVFDRDYAHATAGRDARHAYHDPAVFAAETPLGHYQGVTDQVQMSGTPGRYRTVLVPRGASRPQWLPYPSSSASP